MQQVGLDRHAVDEQARAVIRMHIAKAEAEADATSVRDKLGFRAAQRELARKSGWTKLTGQESIPIVNPGALYLWTCEFADLIVKTGRPMLGAGNAAARHAVHRIRRRARAG